MKTMYQMQIEVFKKHGMTSEKSKQFMSDCIQFVNQPKVIESCFIEAMMDD